MAFQKNTKIRKPTSILFIDPSQVNVDLFVQGVVTAQKEGTQTFILNPNRFASKKLVDEGAVVNHSNNLESNEILAFDPGPYNNGDYYSWLYDEQIEEVVEYIRLKTNYPITLNEMGDIQTAIEAMYKTEGITRTSYKPTTYNRESVLTIDCLLAFIKAKNASLYKIIRDYGSFKKSNTTELQRLFSPHSSKMNLDKDVCLFTYTGIPTSGKLIKSAYFESLCMIHRKVRTRKQKAVVILNTRLAADLMNLFQDLEGLITYIVVFEGSPVAHKNLEASVHNFKQIVVAKPIGFEAETICSFCGVSKKIQKRFIYESDELSDEVLLINRKDGMKSSYFVGSLSEAINLIF